MPLGEIARKSTIQYVLENVRTVRDFKEWYGEGWQDYLASVNVVWINLDVQLEPVFVSVCVDEVIGVLHHAD
jgi:hypothetical protein